MERKSFILHLDSLDVLDELSKEEIADLFIAMKNYNLGINVKLTGLMKAVFIPFKNQFDRDLKKYENTCDRNKNNIGKRWNKKDTKNTTGKNGIPLDTKNTTGKNGIPLDTKNTDNDNDNGNDNDNDNNNDNNNNFISNDIKEQSSDFYDLGNKKIKEENKKEYQEESFEFIDDQKKSSENCEKKEYGESKINLMLGFLKKTVGVDQFKESQKMQRIYGEHFFNFVKSNGKEEFVKRLNEVLKDSFKARNSNSIVYLYKEVKAYIHSPAITPVDSLFHKKIVGITTI